ncbi:MAG: translation initiation factor IF-3 [Patescibacteria group bacterium]|nr:MAG: translation initiation factor IF-3 [Patescibacteria group bacterium]
MNPRNNNNSFGKKYYTINERINAQNLRVLNEFGEMVGVMSRSEALTRAREVDKDLVLVNDQATPAIAKIIDLAKFKYQEQQKAAKSRKSAKAQDIKEVRFSPFMGEGDFESKTKKVRTFLEKGDKVRLSLQFKGREITKKEFGYEAFKRVFSATEDISTIEMQPKLMGKKLLAQLMPAKKKG